MKFQDLSRNGLLGSLVAVSPAAVSLAALLLVACGGNDQVHICVHQVNSTAELHDAVRASSSSADPCAPPVSSADGSAANADFESGLIASSVCPAQNASQRQVAVSGDGSKVAYLSCAGSDIGVVVQALSGGAPVPVADAQAGDSVEFTLDNEHLLFGADPDWSVVRTDGSRPPFVLSEGSIEERRHFRETVDLQGGGGGGGGGGRALEPRLLIQELIGDSRRIVARRPDTDYEEPVVILADGENGFTGSLLGGLQHLSDSGRTLVTPVEVDGVELYFKLRTNAGEAPYRMGFGREDAEMGAAGLGDTHNFAFMGQDLVRISLTADLDNLGENDLVTLAQGGLLEDHSQIIDRQDRPGVKYAHFIQNGDPSRRKREGDEPLQALADANATAQSLSPDSAHLIYLSDDAVHAVSAVGDSAALELIAEAGNRLRNAFAPDSSEVAVVGRGGRLYRSRLDTAGASQLVDPERASEAWFGYNGNPMTPRDELRLVWLSGSDEAVQDRLKTAPLDAAEAITLVDGGVSAWLAIPGSADILYVQSGKLHRATP